MVHDHDDGLWRVIRTQRACRAFTDEAVDDRAIACLLESATFAPSAENLQPWVFIVVRDRAVRTAIGEINRRAWESGARAWEEGRLSPGLLADVESGVQGGIAGAPVIIVVCGDASVAHRQTLASSIFPAVQNLLLTATALGLGSALTTLPLSAPELSDATPGPGAPAPAAPAPRADGAVAADLRSLLELGPELHPLAVVPIGHPARRLGPPRRNDFRASTWRDRFGVPWEDCDR